MAPVANLFEAEVSIIAALQALVDNAPADANARKPLVGSAITMVGTRNPAEFCPGLYVAPSPPTSVGTSGAGVIEGQSWDVVCMVPTIANKPNAPAITHAGLGQLAAAALMAVQGVEGLEYTGRNDIVYYVGYAELTLTFACERQFDPAVETADLADFIRFAAEWDLAAPDGQIDARDLVRVPGASGLAVHRAAHDAARDANWPLADDAGDES